MARKTTIAIGDIDPQAVADDQESIMVLLPVGASGVTETGKTAEETTIQGDRTQKDRGIEFDYPKPKPVVAPRTKAPR